MASRLSIRAFLAKAKESLHQAIQSQQKLTLVVGNESADLDSLTSSLVYSYIRSATHKPAYGSLYIPITNIPAADIALRPEFSALLPHAGLQPSSLITLDDLPRDLTSGFAPENTQWILVDHNALQGALGGIYRQRLVGTIDHHDDEHTVPDHTPDEPRIIDKAGSCTSLVVEYLGDQWSSLEPAGESDSQVAKLALASILIDTVNMGDKSKVTAHDEAAVAYLKTKLPDFDPGIFYAELQNAKQDVGRLCLHDILRKDYKEWEAGELHLGIASVVKPLTFLIDKASSEDAASSFADSVALFAKDRKLDMFAIMTTYTSEGDAFSRELLVYASSESAVCSLEQFEKNSTSKLSLASWKGEMGDIDKGSLKVWVQKAVKHSRKQVAPLLREACRL
ncbi:DHH phosphoesterase [Microthyrium microscopicum]|uniref:DHH phosphoesterase n=1 Tax=Microthyrium microscopicum TaxID=703497 RepID=A0A6A6UNG9_9PEZI|nr:DHH phosphoesterase [Microthyrium microscopicum]